MGILGCSSGRIEVLLLALRSFADGVLFSEVFGQGRPRVLALHGWGRRGADFKQSLHDVSAFAPDLPGFGASPKPDSVIGADGYADIVAQMLDEFDEPPVLVGHSFGGRVAVCLAARMPKRVGPLVLTGVPLIRREAKPPSMTYRTIRTLNELGLISDRRLEVERQKSGSADYRAAQGVMRDILVKVVNEGYQDQLRQIEQPVKMLWGENDEEVPVEVARVAGGLLGDSDLEILQGVGHHVPIEAPEALRRVIDSVMS